MIKTVLSCPTLRPTFMLVLVLALAGCGTRLDFFSKKSSAINQEQAAQIAQLKTVAGARQLWQNSVGGSETVAFSPAVEKAAVYAADASGRLARFDPATGRQTWSVDTQHKLSGGVGSGYGLVLVGTIKGEVLAFDEAGKALWKAQVSSEVLSPPQADDGVVVVRSGDGRIFGLEATSGKRKWVYQGPTPVLTVRSFAGVLISRGAVFAGFAGGKLAAISLANGNVGWEATVAQPRGATELERITDITSLPVLDNKQVCAVAYQGRVACFDIANGRQIWAQDASSNAGLAMDSDYVYVSEDRGAVAAYDKKNGASIWKQEKLGGIKLSAPLVQGERVVVGDAQGNISFLKHGDGAVVARSSTDGGAILTRPESLPNGFVVQTVKGGLYAFGNQ